MIQMVERHQETRCRAIADFEPSKGKTSAGRLQIGCHGSIVLLGNSITLTPGTITVVVDSQDLVVHAMDDSSADDVTSEKLEKHIADLFREKGTG